MEAVGDNEANALPPPVLLFGRPGKKRKIYRQRATEDVGPEDMDQKVAGDNVREGVSPLPEAASSKDVENDDAKPNDGDDDNADRNSDEKDNDSSNSDTDDVGRTVADLVRLRKSRRPRLGGVEFRGGDDDGQSQQSRREMQLSRLGQDLDGYDGDMDLDFLSSESLPVGVRFAPQTGLIGELVNKHMEEYVEAEMAKRYKGQAEQQSSIRGDAGQSSSTPSGTQPSSESREQLAMKGKLHEIDLGAEARARNIALTEQATRRLHGNGEDDDDDDSAAGGKQRLGRDGRPLRRKRRGSEDIKRDQIVEQLLHENRMDVDVYNVSKESAPTTEGKPADDKIAEQFRREFMEAVAQRLRRKRRPLGPPTKPKVRNEEEILRGPKLGGSRNVRSQMRDKLLQKQEEQRQSIPKFEQQLQEQRRKANRRR